MAYMRMQTLDVTGPWEVFDHVNYLLGDRCYRLLLASPDGRAVRTDSGLTLGVDTAWNDVAALDTLLVPGGVGVYDLLGRCSWLESLRSAATRARRVGAVCTGAFALAELGLLDGRRAVTHWAAQSKLGERYPSVHVEDDRLYVRDGVWTSAGVTAGMDMTLAMVEADHGPDIAHDVAKWLVVFMRRLGGDRQLSPPLESQAVTSRTIIRAQSFIANHPMADLRVQALATRVRMSARNFTRVFTKEVGVPPGRYVLQTRLQHARRLLRRTDRGLEDIARMSGLGTREALRRLFRKELGESPIHYRHRQLGEN